MADIVPSPGVSLATAASTSPRLLRPQSFDCLAGTAPTPPAYTPSTLHAGMLTSQRRAQKKLLADGGTVFVIGDSQMQFVDVSGFSAFAFNFGIGGDTAAAYISRLGYFTGLRRAGAVVLQITQNDITGGATLATTKTYYDMLLDWFTGPLVIIEAYPMTVTTWKTDLAALNAYVAAEVVGRDRCEVVSINAEIVDGSGNLRPELTWLSDGQHVDDPTSLSLLATRVAAALRRVTAP